MKSQERLCFIAKEYVEPEEWPTLRGIEAFWDDQTLKISFYFKEEIDDSLKEEASVLATEILAQYVDGDLEENYIHLPCSVRLPDSSFWIYKNPN